MMRLEDDDCSDIPSYSLEVLRKRSMEKNADKFADPRKIMLEIPDHETSRAMEEAVVAHAQLLGIDPYLDKEFLWIAEEALVAELAYPWVEIVDQSSKKTYFLNEETHESTWDSPLDAYYREMFERLKNERDARVRQAAYEQQSQNNRHNNNNNHPRLDAVQREDDNDSSSIKSARRLRRELERERDHYKSQKAEWAQREAQLARQHKRREEQLCQERDEWRAKLVALEKAHMQQETESPCSPQPSIANQSNNEHNMQQVEADRKVKEFLAKEVEELQSANRQLCKDLEQKTALANELEGASAENSHLRKKLEQHEALAKEVEELHTTSGQICKDLEQKTTLVNELKEELCATNAQLRKNLEEKESLAKGVEELRATNVQLRKDLELAANRMTESDAGKDKLLENLDKLATLAEQNEQALQHERVRARELQTNLSKASLELELAKENLCDLRTENAELLQQNLKRSSFSEQLRVQYQERLEALQANLEAEKARCVGAEAALQAAQTSFSELQARLIDAERREMSSTRLAKTETMQRTHVERLLLEHKLTCKCNAKKIGRVAPGMSLLSKKYQQTRSNTNENQTLECEGPKYDSDSEVLIMRQQTPRHVEKKIRQLEKRVRELRRSEANTKEVAAQMIIATTKMI